MKNIKIFKVLSLAALLTGATACTDNFDEINTNTNAPTFDKAAPDQLLTNAIESMTDRVHEIFLGHEMGSGWVQHMAKVQYTDEDRYIYRPDVVSATWNSFYAANGSDVNLIYDIGVDRENANYQGVALVLKAYIASVLTDLFGDVPYSKAWKGIGTEVILSPEYDTQESIYRDIIAKLDEANTLLDPEGLPIAGDILFHNDIAQWKKFANSLRLRLLLRMSGRDAGFVTTEMTKMVDTSPGSYPLFASNSDNAALAYLGSAPNNNPVNENRKGRDDHRVSKNLIDILMNNGDARILVYAKPSDGETEFIGLPNGLTSADAAAYNGNGLANTSKIGDYFTEASAPGMLMSYAELQFILAEAAKRGLIGGGDAAAQAYYEAGIEASFAQYATKLDEVINDTDADVRGDFTNVPVDAASGAEDVISSAAAAYNPANALRLIAEQKYLAMFDQGLQSWFEWRRTGIPVLVVPPDNANGGKIPVRVPYPPIEGTRNADNMNAAIARQGTDDLNTRVWWDVN